VFSIEVKGLDQIQSAFTRLGQQVEGPQPILEAVAERAFYPIVQEIFDSEGRGRWPENTPAYEEAKRRRFGDKPIMQATTALVSSLTKKGATMNIHAAHGRDSLLLGSQVHYSKLASKKRPVFNFRQVDFDRMGHVAVEQIVNQAERLGFKAGQK
jgi:phage gpG-like protein